MGVAGAFCGKGDCGECGQGIASEAWVPIKATGVLAGGLDDLCIFLFFNLFIHIFFGLHWVFVAAGELSLVAASGDYLLFVAVRGLLIAVASLVTEHRL